MIYKKPKKELLHHIGHMSQVAGATSVEFSDGRAKGMRGIEVKTGSGFRFTVLPDRGMDIVYAEYAGKPMDWICRNGLIGPQYFENGGFGFHRTFSGGLVTTCGLTQVGAPCQDGDEILGVHGRISHTPAESVAIREAWDGEDFIIEVSGTLRETSIYAENLVLRRTISTRMGAADLRIHDTITNEGYQESPFMILYHVNFGFPIVTENSKLYSSSDKVTPWINQDGLKAKGAFDTFDPPTPGYRFNLFQHHVDPNKSQALFGIVNEEMQFGGYVSIDPSQLPKVTEWKMMGQQDYVVAIEPGNCIPEGRVEARENGRLGTLTAGGTHEIEYEIGVLDGADAIEAFRKSCR